MISEKTVSSGRVEYGQDHFNSSIKNLDGQLKKILEDLRTQLEETPFHILAENPEVDSIIQRGLEAHIPFTFLDFVIVNSIQDEGQKQLFLMSKHDDYLGSMLYPSHAILAASQGFDLTEVMTSVSPLFAADPEIIAR